MIGRTLDDRYTVLRLLGQGGMGAVYEARHAGTGRRVAVKVILGQAADDELVRRFQREARAVGAVESEHIAQVFDTGRDRETGAPYIAMEFLEGEDVQALIERLGPLPVDLALRIGLQACLGLERAHEAGIVHRDIKPANLFLARKQGGQRVVKVLDFGVAKVADNGLGNGGMTKSGALLGSPLYMSPEQARGSGAIDARSDVWSLGISLYHALSGHRPNEHLTGLGELVLAICTTPVRWIQEIAPWVPPEVAHVVHRALVIDPAGRIASAGELAAALRALLPGGEAIVEAMLVPLDAATRASRAPFGAAPTPPYASSPPFGAALTPQYASSPPFGAASGPQRASAAPFDAALTPQRASAAPLDAMGRPYGAQTGPHALSGTAPATSVRLSNRPERPASRPPVALLAGGVLAAALAGGAGVYLAVRRAPPPAPSADPAPPPRAEAEPPPPSAGVETRPAPRAEPPRADAEPPRADAPGAPPATASSTPEVLPSPATSARVAASASASAVARPPAPRPSAVRPASPPRPPRNDDDETSRK
ncbi:protein kinase domain-containing protein [Sorangium sp. So ce1000]|uniref:protein kinase domain-containing protein n=1 Tax=Sorangium sp. So ce1000 TaxID=3133325 RepID=UPI003F5FDD72